MATGCLQLFARLPVPGAVKTRLIPALGVQGACALHTRLLEGRFALLQACRQDPGMAVEWWVDSLKAHPLREQFHGAVLLQRGSDLGERMLFACTSALQRPQCRLVILIGSDCPALNQDTIREACSALEAGHDVVLCPAFDGGYVLIGLSAAARPVMAKLFRGIDWGTERVLEQTLCRIRDAGLTCCLLRALPDVDRPEDLQYVATT